MSRGAGERRGIPAGVAAGGLGVEPERPDAVEVLPSRGWRCPGGAAWWGLSQSVGCVTIESPRRCASGQAIATSCHASPIERAPSPRKSKEQSVGRTFFPMPFTIERALRRPRPASLRTYAAPRSQPSRASACERACMNRVQATRQFRRSQLRPPPARPVNRAWSVLTLLSHTSTTVQSWAANRAKRSSSFARCSSLSWNSRPWYSSRSSLFGPPHVGPAEPDVGRVRTPAG